MREYKPIIIIALVVLACTVGIITACVRRNDSTSDQGESTAVSGSESRTADPGVPASGEDLVDESTNQADVSSSSESSPTYGTVEIIIPSVPGTRDPDDHTIPETRDPDDHTVPETGNPDESTGPADIVPTGEVPSGAEQSVEESTPVTSDEPSEPQTAPAESSAAPTEPDASAELPEMSSESPAVSTEYSEESTGAPTEAPTETPTEAPTETPTEATEPAGQSEVPTDAESSTETEESTEEPTEPIEPTEPSVTPTEAIEPTETSEVPTDAEPSAEPGESTEAPGDQEGGLQADDDVIIEVPDDIEGGGM